MHDSSFPDALASDYQLHWYVLERVLGQGGFGITYLARDSNLDKLVAIKEYLPVDTATRRADATVAPRSNTQAERYQLGLDGFIREARTLARFNHPHIVRVHSVFQHNNTAYMVMEYEDGETLASLLERRKTLPEKELLDILLPIIDGLALVHAEGFIHRDIKPENILIRKDSSPVLLDFGSARSGMGQSRTVTILVAPGYAPFEQYYANGESQGPWTDIYGLGATCYRAIAGAAPIDAITRSKGVLGSTREVLVPVAEHGAGRYSTRFLAAVEHALAFAERDRPQSLGDWKHELVGDAVPEATASVAPAAAPAAVAPASTATAGLREVVAWTALGATLAALGIALWTRTPVPVPVPVPDPDRLAQPARPPASQADAQPVVVLPTAVSSAPAAPAVVADAPASPPAAARVVVREAAATRNAPVLRAAQPSTVARSGAPPPPPAAAGPVVASAVVPAVVAAQTNMAAPVQPAPVPAALTPLAAAPAPVPTPAPVPAAAPVASAPVAPPEPTAQPAPTNEKDAFAFYRARALKGDSEAQMQVGEMYAAGKGIGVNHNSAYFWFGVAARTGNASARSKMSREAQRLQPVEVRQADRQIDSFGKGSE